MDARKSAIFEFQFVKPILQTITHLIQYTVLEIQCWYIKCKTVAVPCMILKDILSISIPSHKSNHFKMLFSIFSTTYTYSNC